MNDEYFYLKKEVRELFCGSSLRQINRNHRAVPATGDLPPELLLSAILVKLNFLILAAVPRVKKKKKSFSALLPHRVCPWGYSGQLNQVLSLFYSSFPLLLCCFVLWLYIEYKVLIVCLQSPDLVAESPKEFLMDVKLKCNVNK